MNGFIKVNITLIFLLLHLFLLSQNTKENFVGKWKAPKGAIIIISLLDDAFIGKTEKENAIVLKDVVFVKGRWYGVVLNSLEHLTAKCELILYQRKIKIIARKGIFHKTLYWTKV